MTSRASLAAALAMAGACSIAQAQAPWTLEAGAFAQASFFDDQVPLNDGWSAGARLGVFLLSGLAIEGDIATGRPTHLVTGERESFTPFYMRVAWNSSFNNPAQLILGLGGVRNNYGGTHEGALNALIGMRWIAWGRLGVRVDGMMDYQASLERTHWHARAGLSFLPGLLRPPRIADRDHDGVTDDLDRCLDTPPGDPIDRYGCSLPRDADRDGVNDANDACPDTPAGTTVDARGCPLPPPEPTPAPTPAPTPTPSTDADGDGVPDATDRCPATPAGTPVDASGCPDSTRIDTDGDGVMDASDRCSFTPAGTTVDEHGCPPPPDTDRDGVADPNDQCPTTAPGAQVDAVGCPVVFTDTTRTFTLRGVNFQSGRANLRPESYAVLDEMVTVLNNNATVRVEIAGHTDNVGSDAVNERLSQQRAEAVRDYLVSKGIAAGRLTAVGYGEKEPVADNSTPAGRAQNRRVELRRID